MAIIYTLYKEIKNKQKQTMTFRIILSLTLFLCVSIAFTTSNTDEAKPNYPGFLIWNDGVKETVKIQPGSITDNEVKIKYLVNGKVITIKPDDIKAYGYSKKISAYKTENFYYDRLEMAYPAKPFGSNTAMVLREVEGPISLYSYFVEVRADRKNPVQHRPHVRNEKGKLIELTEENFKKKTRLLFGKYDALRAKIGTKKFQLKNLRRMVRDYNYWVAEQHDPTVYKVSPENYDVNQ